MRPASAYVFSKPANKSTAARPETAMASRSVPKRRGEGGGRRRWQCREPAMAMGPDRTTLWVLN
eukprot:6192738-Pleurochrysis_carterae.AAC.1